MHAALRRYRQRERARRRILEAPFWRAVVELADDAKITAMAAQIAFNAVFSLGPMLSLSLMVLAMVPEPSVRHSLERMMRVAAPSAIHPFLDAVTREITRSGHPVLLVVSVIGLLWTISGAASAVLTALEEFGEPVTIHPVRRRLQALVLGAAAALGLIVVAVAVSLAPAAVGFIGRVLGLHLHAFQWLSNPWVRMPAAGLSFALLSLLFLAFGTTRRHRYRALLAGSLCAGVMVSLASAGLSSWLTYAPRLGGGYGTATSFFGVLLWLYLLGFSLLLGGCVAHVLDQRVRHERRRPYPPRRFRRRETSPPAPLSRPGEGESVPASEETSPRPSPTPPSPGRERGDGE